MAATYRLVLSVEPPAAVTRPSFASDCKVSLRYGYCSFLGIFAPFADAAAVRNSASSSLAGPTEAVATHLPRALFRFEQLKRFATRAARTLCFHNHQVRRTTNPIRFTWPSVPSCKNNYTRSYYIEIRMVAKVRLYHDLQREHSTLRVQSPEPRRRTTAR